VRAKPAAPFVRLGKAPANFIVGAFLLTNGMDDFRGGIQPTADQNDVTPGSDRKARDLRIAPQIRHRVHFQVIRYCQAFETELAPEQ